MGIIKLTLVIVLILIIAFFGITVLKRVCLESADYEGIIMKIQLAKYKEGYSNIADCKVIFDNNKELNLKGLICEDLILGNYLKYNSMFRCWDVTELETEITWEEPTIFEHTIDDENNAGVRYD